MKKFEQMFIFFSNTDFAFNFAAVFADNNCEEVFFMSEKKFAVLDRKNLDRLNDMQHEITDESGKGVILVAFNKDCGGSCGCH